MKMKNFLYIISILVIIFAVTYSPKNSSNVQYMHINLSEYKQTNKHELQNFPQKLIKKIPAKKIPQYTFNLYRISAYTNSIRETDSTPFNTSCGHVNDVKYRPIIAVSRDIFFYKGYKWLCGKTARIVYDDGTYIEGVIYDTMNSRYKNTSDVLIRKITLTKAKIAAFKHGVKTGKLIIY